MMKKLIMIFLIIPCLCFTKTTVMTPFLNVFGTLVADSVATRVLRIYPASGYIWFGDDYGLRDNAGQMEFKNSGGVWTAFSDAGGSEWYGVAWDAKASANTFTRLGTLADSSADANIPDYMLPVQASMERCLLKNDGTVSDMLKSDNSNYKANGDAADLSGASGQVMVRIKKFYYYFHYDGIDSIFTWKISPDSIAGFVAHPAFFKDSVWVPYRYFGAYEGSMKDNTDGEMVDSALVHTNMYAAGDSLCSVCAGDTIYPKTNEQRTEYRAAAALRGSGWRLMTFYDNAMLQLLYLIEYASFDSQTKIGDGRTDLSGQVTNGWVAGSYIGLCGLSNSSGNFTNEVSDGDSATSYMSYRGIENLYGSVWKMLDGITWDASANDEVTDIPVWVSNHESYFQNNSSTGMVKLCNATNSGSTDAGYQYYMENIDGFLPSKIGENRVGDYYYQYPDNGQLWRLVMVGGSATYGSAAGVFTLHAAGGFAADGAYVGARLSY